MIERDKGKVSLILENLTHKINCKGCHIDFILFYDKENQKSCKLKEAV